MKAAANGVLNCSILDGWWVEGYDAPTSAGRSAAARTTPTPDYQDHVESQALYDMLEKQIVPLFYERGVDNMPREWIARMKNCMRKLAPVFNTNRMVQDYAEKFYIPALDRGETLAADGMKRSDRAGAAEGPPAAQVGRRSKIVGVHTSGNGHFKVGEQHAGRGAGRPARTSTRRTCTVQLYAGPINAHAARSSTPQRDGDDARRSRWRPAGTCSSARSTAARAAGRASRSASCPATRTWRRRSSRG